MQISYGKVLSIITYKISTMKTTTDWMKREWFNHSDRDQQRYPELDSYPNGTLAKAIMGGHWCKMPNGWKWNGPDGSGSTFPRPGGDWSGDIHIPDCHKFFYYSHPESDSIWKQLVPFVSNGSMDDEHVQELTYEEFINACKHLNINPDDVECVEEVIAINIDDFNETEDKSESL
jgi:hypothetical protein